MSAYEFWDELGNIFNAIVAYQEKTIEFNKRFVNPWVRLGTVLDQNDNNAETLVAHRKAIEIDKDNAANWLALGDVYFKMGSFEEASTSYSKAIELNPKLGWAYANLALTHATRQKYTDAINMYVKSLELITDEKDRAMIWNRLGNVYRKVNDYENAFIAFQMADECDGQNTGFEDRLDDVAVEQRVTSIVAEVYVNNNYPPVAEEVLVVTPEVAQPTEIAETIAPMAETSVETLEQEITDSQFEEIISEPVADEVSAGLDEAVELALPEEAIAEISEIPELEMALEQNLDVEDASVDVVEAPSAAEQETERLELEEMIRAIITKHSTEEPTVTEGTVQVAATMTDMEANEPVVEDNAVEDISAEVVEETPLLETLGVESEAETELIASFNAELIIEDKQLEEAAESAVAEIVNDEPQVETVAETPTEETNVEEMQPEAATELPEQEIIAEEPLVMEETPAPEFLNADISTSTTMTPVMAHETGTFANPLDLNQPVVLVVENLAELIDEVATTDEAEVEAGPVETETQPEVQVAASDLIEEVVESGAQPESNVVSDEVATTDEAEVEAEPIETETQPEVLVAASDLIEEVVESGAQPESNVVSDEVTEVIVEVLEVQASAVSTELPAADETQPESFATAEEIPLENTQPETVNETVVKEPMQSAYDEFLKNAVEPMVILTEKPSEVMAHEANFTNSKTKRELKVEPDTKNAHVWNELGNVYFNTGAYEEAVTAYSKAIELDDWFAWPYSNLALVYVQKEKYAEAVLLYQRSIELFASDKDKAVTWNRLGNVYRRLNDYDNAIACYQRADELDPNNATLSQRLRFSLLGSLNMETSPSLAV